MKKILSLIIFSLSIITSHAQLHWQKADTALYKLPQGLQLFYTNDSIEGKPNIAYYIEADLSNPHLIFDVDTTFNRRLTPTEFYKKNNEPLIVVNGTFIIKKSKRSYF